jgi:hypothetical protein
VIHGCQQDRHCHLRLHAGHAVEDVQLVHGEIDDDKCRGPLAHVHVPGDCVPVADRDHARKNGGQPDSRQAAARHQGLTAERNQDRERRREPMHGAFARMVRQSESLGRVPHMGQGDQRVLPGAIRDRPEETSGQNCEGHACDEERMLAKERADANP